MKRIGAILCLSLLIVLMTTSFSFAASLEVTDSYPRDGGKGMQLVNTGVKLYFNQPMKSSKAIQADQDCFKFTDEDGNVQPIRVVYSDKDPKQVLVIINKSLEQETTYKLTISKDLMSKSGDTLGEEETISFTTRDTSVDTKVNMGMMAVMMVGMVWFTSRSAKSHVKKELIAEGKEEVVNPYKVAKETGKSIEEIVAKDQKAKEKHKKKREKMIVQQVDKQEDQASTDNNNKRVKAPKRISEGGSTYLTGRKAKAEEEAKKRAAAGTTHPKSKSKKRK
ncbi:Ig-like domain-containing protein [Clostridium aminobutyricum]|uniref:Ig-like domain-containing protein n=1 Tax=Clostridium aminobutyricum TaxID=33953 RepID=A0A939DAI2_CLOAM|nr:Ig-like domain-containing protein [Clostridium aminobutyricum]MBN7774125.1 Ig-like domain-containing protein [Clostridium aminobutyricum]